MAQCGGICVAEINKLELELCEVLRWRLTWCQLRSSHVHGPMDLGHLNKESVRRYAPVSKIDFRAKASPQGHTKGQVPPLARAHMQYRSLTAKTATEYIEDGHGVYEKRWPEGRSLW